MSVLNEGEITTVFQPIVSLKDGSIMGIEALSRGPEGSMLESPSSLFEVARVYGKLWELEFLCRIKALESISAQEQDYFIFLNVDPHIINDEKFKKGFTKDFLKQFGIETDKIIMEITEKSAVEDVKSFKKVIENYKEQGYKIAIDDTGAGYSGLNLITDIHPHFLKLDMNLIRDIDKDGLKHALIKTFCDFCMITDIKIIAEGIETENELKALIDIGVHYGQGYFIQKPRKELGKISPQIVHLIKTRNYKKGQLHSHNCASLPIRDICHTNILVPPSCTGAKLIETFNSNPGVFGIPVVDHQKVVGLIMKDKFYAKLGTQYGFALFINRPVNILMNRRPLQVDYETSIELVSKLSMTRSPDQLYDYIIVTKDGNYLGIVTIKDLLEKTIELEVNYAKHLNPLSGLPGNLLIEHKLKELIGNVVCFTVLYIDIDNFKAYNDAYGFENGDRVLQFVARILKEIVQENCAYNHFIGHVGGDDFVIIIENYDVQLVCDRILKAFEKGISEFYNAVDRDKKYILTRNRRGEIEQYGLLTVSIAGISNRSKSFRNIYELSEDASKLKKKCKEIWDNCCYIE